MKKMSVFCFLSVFIILFSISSKAETVNGVDFDIPEDWQLVDSSDDNFSSRTYSCDNQVIMITVGGVQSNDVEMQALNNLYLLDCNSVFGEYDGFYLMTDESVKSDDGFLTKTQECVYQGDGWYYTYLCGVNTGNAAISFAYVALSVDDHSRIREFFDLANDFIPDLGFAN